MIQARQQPRLQETMRIFQSLFCWPAGPTMQVSSSSSFGFYSCFMLCMFLSHLLQGQSIAPVPLQLRLGEPFTAVVKSGNMPIPGAGVSASNAATKEQVNTWTEVDGSYWLRIPADGHYTVRVQMAAFAAGAQEVVLDAAIRTCRRILN